MEYIKLLIDSSIAVLSWTSNQIFFKVPHSENYFWGLIIISLLVWIFEIIFPWRKSQKIFRKGFWIDIIYMFFNFFLFSIIIVGFYEAFNKLLFDLFGIAPNSIALIDLSTFSQISQLIIYLIIFTKHHKAIIICINKDSIFPINSISTRSILYRFSSCS